MSDVIAELQHTDLDDTVRPLREAEEALVEVVQHLAVEGDPYGGAMVQQAAFAQSRVRMAKQNLERKIESHNGARPRGPGMAAESVTAIQQGKLDPGELRDARADLGRALAMLTLPVRGVGAYISDETGQQELQETVGMISRAYEVVDGILTDLEGD